MLLGQEVALNVDLILVASQVVVFDELLKVAGEIFKDLNLIV